MIPKSAILIIAALLVAIEAKSSPDLIGERLKVFHDHFTSQAKEIKDAGINTENIMKSLSTQLKSLLLDAIKEMDDLGDENVKLDSQNKALIDENNVLEKKNEELTTQTKNLKAEVDKWKSDYNGLKVENQKLNTENQYLSTANATCHQKLQEMTEICHKSLTECKHHIEYLGEELVKCKDKCGIETKPCHTCEVTPEMLAKCEATQKRLAATNKKLMDEATTLKYNNKRLMDQKKKCAKDQEICQGGWEMVSGRYVKFVDDRKVTWSEAEEYCQERNAHLVMVKDDETFTWTKKFHTPMWLGATDEGHDDVWLWMDGSQVADQYWGAGEPSHSLLTDENCMATNYKSIWMDYGEWVDKHCQSKLKFACELPRV